MTNTDKAPPTLPVSPRHPYATFIPTRRPQIKTHTRVEHAKNAVNNFQNTMARDGSYDCDMVVYELVGEEYVPWIRIVKGTQRDDYPDLAKKPARKGDLYLEMLQAQNAATQYMQIAKEKAEQARELRHQLYGTPKGQ